MQALGNIKLPVALFCSNSTCPLCGTNAGILILNLATCIKNVKLIKNTTRHTALNSDPKNKAF